MKFLPYVSPMRLVLRSKFHPEILRVPPPSGGVKQWWGGENQPFYSFKRQYLAIRLKEVTYALSIDTKIDDLELQ